MLRIAKWLQRLVIVMDDLIYDRTQNDVNRAIELNDKYNDETITAEEIIEWNNGLKGAYDYTDLNRVEQWCTYLSQQLNLYNYSVTITTKTDWIMYDFPTSSELKRIRENVAMLKNAFVSYTSVPDNMQKMTYQKANAIEKVLSEINTSINSMIASFNYSNDIFAGEV